jgi:hypothetical protein
MAPFTSGMARGAVQGGMFAARPHIEVFTVRDQHDDAVTASGVNRFVV